MTIYHNGKSQKQQSVTLQPLSRSRVMRTCWARLAFLPSPGIGATCSVCVLGEGVSNLYQDNPLQARLDWVVINSVELTFNTITTLLEFQKVQSSDFRGWMIPGPLWWAAMSRHGRPVVLYCWSLRIRVTPASLGDHEKNADKSSSELEQCSKCLRLSNLPGKGRAGAKTRKESLRDRDGEPWVCETRHLSPTPHLQVLSKQRMGTMCTSAAPFPNLEEQWWLAQARHKPWAWLAGAGQFPNRPLEGRHDTANIYFPDKSQICWLESEFLVSNSSSSESTFNLTVPHSLHWGLIKEIIHSFLLSPARLFSLACWLLMKVSWWHPDSGALTLLMPLTVLSFTHHWSLYFPFTSYTWAHTHFLTG